jgi:hypothetical protein
MTLRIIVPLDLERAPDCILSIEIVKERQRMNKPLKISRASQLTGIGKYTLGYKDNALQKTRKKRTGGSKS